MKFPYSILRDFVDTQLDPQAAGDLLTMAGFEVEGIERVEDEYVLDVKVMSNRGDGLSVLGLAREILAKDAEARPRSLYQRAVDRFSGATPAHTSPETSVEIETPDCTRYACLILRNFSHKESEPWMQTRLRQAGMRPIGLLVDVTNYVMLELGQPLHAFDFDKLTGGRIVVRKAREREELTTLNGQAHRLNPDQMMICDAVRPVAVAGVMGGLDTEVSSDTRTVLLESAHFVNTSVRRTRKQLGLSTEASYRFERSVDPNGVVSALYRCVELLHAADPGTAASSLVDNYPAKPTCGTIKLRISRASELLGTPVPETEAAAHLKRLGFDITSLSDGVFNVSTPSWRPDIVREIDLIEELGRVHGYDKIPETLLNGTIKMGGPQGFELWTDWLRNSILRAGFSQTISHALSDLHPLDDPAISRLCPRNPASPDMAYLRNSLLSSLGEAARRNNPKDANLFEIGHVFGVEGTGHVEQIRLAMLAAGPVTSSGWSTRPSGQSDFFNLKGAIETCFASVGVTITLSSGNANDPRMHPTRQAIVSAGDAPIGVLGQIHPDSADACGLIPETCLAEIRIEEAFKHRDLNLKLERLSRHPSVRRDMSILIDKSVRFEDIAVRIDAAGGDVLERRWLFDVFAGQGIPEGKHALGIAIQLRKQEATFTDEEANQVRDRVVAALAELGATMR